MVLNCEMCGSSLNVNKAINDVVVCEYCDSATNIHGFIHLNMSSDQRAAALMKRGFVLTEFGIWDKAKFVLKKAVEYDSENAKAYLGLLMVDTKSTKEELLYLHKEMLSNYENYHKALQFADVELKGRLESYNHKIEERIREEEIRRQKQQREMEQKQREEDAKMQALKEKEEEEREKTVVNITIFTFVIILVIIIIVIVRAVG